MQAELDGELDAAAAAALAAHKTGCPVCREAAADIARARAAIDRSLYHAMPDALRTRILAEIEAAREPAPRPRSSMPSRRWRLDPAVFRLRPWRFRSRRGVRRRARTAAAVAARPEPHRADRRWPYPRDAARPSGGCRIERPAYGEAMVQRPPRLHPAGQGFRRPGVSAAGRPARLSGRTPGRRAGISARQARHRPFRLAGKRQCARRRRRHGTRATMSCTGPRTAWCSGRFPMSSSTSCGISPTMAALGLTRLISPGGDDPRPPLADSDGPSFRPAPTSSVTNSHTPIPQTRSIHPWHDRSRTMNDVMTQAACTDGSTGIDYRAALPAQAGKILRQPSTIAYRDRLQADRDQQDEQLSYYPKAFAMAGATWSRPGRSAPPSRPCASASDAPAFRRRAP